MVLCDGKFHTVLSEIHLPDTTQAIFFIHEKTKRKLKLNFSVIKIYSLTLAHTIFNHFSVFMFYVVSLMGMLFLNLLESKQKTHPV
jgi:hypothetical protein